MGGDWGKNEGAENDWTPQSIGDPAQANGTEWYSSTRRWAWGLILLPFILDQLEDDLAPLVFRMLHAYLHSVAIVRQGSAVR